MGRVTIRRRVTRLAGTEVTVRPDTLVAEEPLEIRVAGRPLTITMRTPGNDFDLAAGFLVSEGVVRCADEVVAIRYCAGATDDGGNTYNIVDVALAAGVPAPDPSLERNFYTTSSCGLCGKASLDAVRTTAAWSVRDDPMHIDAAVVAELPDRLRSAQRIFASTGGLHAAGLFTADGRLLCLREDVGRHNAVDKVVGWALREDRLPLRGTQLLVSGRASFELVQKAVMAGIPALAAVSAPSSLAADLASDAGLTLIGFLRGSSMNVYSGAHRLGLVDTAVVGV
jgi:FdhD protein